MRIIIGVDPHKKTHTASAVDAATGELLADLTVPANGKGCEELLAWATALAPRRVFAVEDVRQVSGGLEHFLLCAGEETRRVSTKLMGTSRRQGRQRGKSDAIDSLAVARAALREPNLPHARPDGEWRDIRLLLDHREDLVYENTRMQNRLYWHLHSLNPPIEVPAHSLRHKVWLGRVARALAKREQTMQVRIARELRRRSDALRRECYALEMEICKLVKERAPGLLAIPGCAGLTSARILAEVGDISRFKSPAQLAMHAGVSPISASSGAVERHRLNRYGNRKLNAALYRIAVTQVRVHEPAIAYVAKKKAEGKSNREAIRCLKRYLARRVFLTLWQEASQTQASAPLSA